MASGVFTVAVCQFVPGAEPRDNLAAVEELATAAHDRGAELVVFPEYSSYFTSPLGRGFVDAAEPLDGPFTSGLAELAGRLRIHLVAGLVEKSGQDRFANTLVAVGREGDVVATYRKQHLYDAFGARESDWATPGELAQPQTFEVGGISVGMQTCYDLRFPEVTRTLVDAGAELVLVPAQWVPGRLKSHHWRTLLTARAIENTVYVAAADHGAPSGVGISMIVDPAGVVLAELGERERDLALAPVTRHRLEEVREANPSLALRRYGVLPLSGADSS